MQREPIWERARGRWPGILVNIGVPAKALRNKHGPCPLCGGKDRFRFDDKGGAGTFYCSQCGPGNGVQLVERFLSVEFKDAAREIEKHLGDAPVMPTSSGQRRPDASLREQMTRIWQKAVPIAPDCPAGLYLHRRAGLTEFPPVLRFSSSERYTEAGARPSYHPALIARVDPSDEARANGERAALHRTFLDRYGDKAEVSSPRKMLGNMPTGAAVRLAEPQDGILGIAEGIETAFAASALHGVPVWAALTADLLMAWEPPAGIETVFIFGDNDKSLTGQAVAYGLGRRLKAKKIKTIVQIPPIDGTDWNDVFLKGQQQ